MFRNIIMAVVVLALVFFVSNKAMAEESGLAKASMYELEKPHTQILFFVDHLGFAKSQGKFLDFDGDVHFDHEHPEKSNVNVVIKTASIEMNHEKWNAHMMNEDFFNVETFPEMTFKSTGIEVTGEDTAKITGDLTLLGVTKPVVLDVKHNKTGTHPYSGKEVAGFSATTTIDREEFGMTYGLPAVGKMVEVRLEVEAHAKPATE